MYIFSNISILYKLSIYNNIFVKKLYKILICHILMNKQIVIMEIAHSCSLNRGLYTIPGIDRFLLQIKVFNRFFSLSPLFTSRMAQFRYFPWCVYAWALLTWVPRGLQLLLLGLFPTFYLCFVVLILTDRVFVFVVFFQLGDGTVVLECSLIVVCNTTASVA